ncbi:sensor histidine kinase [Nonomuraea roseoviolacea]|uniref:sensor histidine kinase n=1 Tax=Nonomuraea roseoviolacea TaxID=103837 RepID=UPI003CD089E1
MHEPNPLFARRLSRGQLVMLDLLAGLCFSFVFLMAPTPIFDVPWARLAVCLGLGLPLALRRVWPVPVFCLVLTVSVAAVVLGVVSIAYVAPAYALYIVALTDDRGALAPTMAIAVLTLITLVGLVAMGGSPQPGAPSWFAHLDVPLLGIAALGGSWTVGRAVRERRTYAARDAERLAEQKVTEERLRIARELHDVVTHSVGLIAVKAGVANHVVRSKPEEAHDALKVIETVSRGALVEMRHLLGVLRSKDDPDRGPLPRLNGIRELAERARLAGVEVELDLRFTSVGVEGDAASGGVKPPSGVGSAAMGGSHLSDGGSIGLRGGTPVPGGRLVGAKGGGPVPEGGPLRSGAGSSAPDRSSVGAEGGGPVPDRSSVGPEGGRSVSGVRSVGAEGRIPVSGEGLVGAGGGGSSGAGPVEAGGGSPALGGRLVGPEAGSRVSSGRGVGPRDRGPVGDGGPVGSGGRHPVPRDGAAASMGESGAEDLVAEEREGSGRPGGASGERRLPAGVELSAYRIVQEALTNVAKHAAPTRCRVSVVAGSSEVRIEVTNDRAAGRGLATGNRGVSMGSRDAPTGSRHGGSGLAGGEPAMEGAGHGLIGMRERVAMFGGAFEAGTIPGGGFRVLATLPYGSAS